MIIGFTGTRTGITISQTRQIIDLLDDKTLNIVEVHHGDCKGADADFHNLCLLRNIKIVIHPPIYPKERAFCKSDFIMPPLQYLDRNVEIVNSCDILIACPKNEQEELRSGTWATIRYAKKINKKTLIFV